MLPIAFNIVRFVVLGALLNVAIAWMCSLQTLASAGFLTGGRIERHNLNPTDEWIAGAALAERCMYRGVSGLYAIRCEDSGFGIHRTEVSLSRITSVPAVIVTSAGWPCHSVQGGYWCDWTGFDPVKLWKAPFQPRGIIELNLTADRAVSQQHRRVLPVLPIMTGFAINTLLYAGVVWLCFAAPIAARKHLRLKRGLCVECAYDLRGGDHPRCPECGAIRIAPRRKRLG